MDNIKKLTWVKYGFIGLAGILGIAANITGTKIEGLKFDAKINSDKFIEDMSKIKK
jgi:hypothetical protein